MGNKWIIMANKFSRRGLIALGLEFLPAQPLEENMVTLSAVFNASQQAHRGITPQVFVELHGVEILHGNPSEYCPRLFYIRSASAHQLSHQVGEGFLIFLGYLRITPIS